MTELERTFHAAAQMPRDGCPLPEPGKDNIPVIQHVGHMRVKPRLGTDPDKAQNRSEKGRFKATVKRMVSSGQIGPEEAQRILSGVN
jgi:hypothetical protein